MFSTLFIPNWGNVKQNVYTLTSSRSMNPVQFKSYSLNASAGLRLYQPSLVCKWVCVGSQISCIHANKLNLK